MTRIFKLILPIVLLVIILISIYWIFEYNRKEKAFRESSDMTIRENTEQKEGQFLSRIDNGEGNVQIEVTYTTPKILSSIVTTETYEKINFEKNYVFMISINTHSVNLDQFDFVKLVFLRTESGEEFPALAKADTFSGESHHKLGVVEFSKKIQNESIFSKNDKSFELIIKSVSGVEERNYKFPLPLPEV